MDPRASAWAASGAMALTGRPDGPYLGAPGALVELMAQASGTLNRLAGREVIGDGLALLGERAALAGLGRQGPISCGGSTQLVRALDGWLAVSLARPDDVAALPAWLGHDVPAHDPWPAVHEWVAPASTAALDDAAALLGLPIAALGSVAPPTERAFGLPLRAASVDCSDLPSPSPPALPGVSPPVPIAGALVVDLSALWAGPLCGQLLAAAGARVVKVESVARPDGARQGPQEFFDLLNGAKQSVALDLATSGGRHDLQRLLAAADVVIESARPRALEQMGIVAADVVQHPQGPRVWVSITSHGRTGQGRTGHGGAGAGRTGQGRTGQGRTGHGGAGRGGAGAGDRDHPAAAGRVAFGDVAAVAGGLVATDARGPCFVADAVTDPLTGLVAAAAVAEALAAGGRWLLDAAMAPLAAAVAGPPLPTAGTAAQPARARPVERAAAAYGADTAAVLAGLTS